MPPEEDRATDMGNMHKKKSGKDRTCSSGDMLADRQTNKQTRHVIIILRLPYPEAAQYHQVSKKLLSLDATRPTSGLHTPSMSSAQGTTLHDRLLHPHPRHCSSPASAVRRLPSAVRTATPAFHVRSSGLFCSRPGRLELITRLPARSVTFL